MSFFSAALGPSSCTELLSFRVCASGWGSPFSFDAYGTDVKNWVATSDGIPELLGVGEEGTDSEFGR